MIKATTEFVGMIEKSVQEWKTLKSQLEKKHHKYDAYAEDYLGIRVDFSAYEDVVVINGASVIDEDKYINFLLKYGVVHND